MPSPGNSPGQNDRLVIKRPASVNSRSDQRQSQAAQDAATRLKARVREPENPKHRRALGSGSFGNVYEALDIETGALIAVKKMGFDPHLVKKEQIERIVLEIQIMKSMKHKNIIEYIGAGRMDEGTSLWIAMECAVGGSLAGVVSKYGNLPESVVKKYVRDCVEGLQYLHSNKVAHRDIKAENLLLCDGGVVKLADFGSAKKFSEEEGLTSTLIGTPLFLAPEVAALHLNGGFAHQLNGNQQSTSSSASSPLNNNNNQNQNIASNATTTSGDPDKRYDVYKADVYTLGITVIQLLTGKPPFEKQLHWMMYVQDPEAKIEIPKNISAECNDFIASCLKRNPKERPSASELLVHPFIADVVSKSNLERTASSVMALNNSASSCPTIMSPNMKTTLTPSQQQQKTTSQASVMSGLTLDNIKQHDQLVGTTSLIVPGSLPPRGGGIGGNGVSAAQQQQQNQSLRYGGSPVVANMLNDLKNRTGGK